MKSLYFKYLNPSIQSNKGLREVFLFITALPFTFTFKRKFYFQKAGSFTGKESF